MKDKIKQLFDEMICPMCYRLNPQHASQDNGKGCHSCKEKEDWEAQIKELEGRLIKKGEYDTSWRNAGIS